MTQLQVPTLLYVEPSVGDRVKETLRKILDEQEEIVRELYSIGVDKRARFLGEIGNLWAEKLESGKYAGLIETLAKRTGYSKRNVELDLSFIRHVLDEFSIKIMLNKGLIGGIKSIDEPVQVSEEEFIINRPVGSVYIIASGNSVIPPLLPMVASLGLGNLTVLRPSLVNYEIIAEIYGLFREALTSGFESADVMIKGLIVLGLRHDDPLFDELLTSYRFSAINYWGGEPGRSRIVSLVSRNPYRPRLVVNGPLTGVSIIDDESAGEEVAKKLAIEILLYEQQLCSSPTTMLFIGSEERLENLLERLEYYLKELGDSFKVEATEGTSYSAFLVYKKLVLSGKKTLFSMDASNPWMIIINEGINEWPTRDVPLYQRRRILEIVRLRDISEVREALDKLENWLRSQGVDGVQTISYALSEDKLNFIIKLASLKGIYRIVPLGASYLRTPTEPYDGEFMPMHFSKALYIRKKYIDLLGV